MDQPPEELFLDHGDGLRGVPVEALARLDAQLALLHLLAKQRIGALRVVDDLEKVVARTPAGKITPAGALFIIMSADTPSFAERGSEDISGCLLRPSRTSTSFPVPTARSRAAWCRHS